MPFALINKLELFDETTLSEEPLEGEDGVIVVVANLIETGEPDTVGYKFDPEIFDVPTIEQWLADRDIQAIEIKELDEPEDESEEENPEPTEEEDPEQNAEDSEDEEMAEDDKPKEEDEEMAEDDKPKEEDEEDDEKQGNLFNFEIFRAGKWNGDDYTRADIDEIVNAFKHTKKNLKPYLKLGHNDEQRLLAKDGLPSAGWITDVRRDGDRLLADIKGIPKKIFALIKSKRYARVSSEIYWDLKHAGQTFKRALKAVALLGADTPAVGSMDDLVDLYYSRSQMCLNYSASGIKTIETELTEVEKKEYELKIQKLESENKQLKAKAQQEKKAQREREVKAYIEQKLKEGKITPAQVEHYTALALNGADKIVHSYIDDNENKTIEGDSFEVVKGIIDNNPTVIEFVGQTRFVESKSERGIDDDEKLDLEIRSYMKENNMKESEYAEAFDAVAKLKEIS